jgi:hypothetical protein
MPERLRETVRQFRDNGWTVTEVREAIEAAASDCVAETADHCQTEPDGYCEHGYPSVLVAFGLI